MTQKNININPSGEKASLHFIEMLFRSYYKPLCKFIFQITKDSEQAEDIAQEVFMKLWQKRDQLDESLSVKSYLYKSAYNTAINLVNREKRSQPVDDFTYFDSPASDSADSDLHYREIEIKIHQAIEKLPLKCKTVFLLSRKEEMSNKEIAAVMDISIKTVENQMTKALATLREELQPYMDYLLLVSCLVWIYSI